MRFKRFIASSIACLLLVLAFSACGSNAAAEYRIAFDAPVYSLVSGNADFQSVKAEVTVYAPSSAARGKKVTFSVSDPSVAEVDNNGNLTAKAHGTTTLTAECGDAAATAEVRVYVPATKEQVNSFDEKYIRRYGRQYVTEDGLNVDHVASGAELAFCGTRITAEIYSTATIYARIYIDGEEGTFTEIKAGTNMYTLADNLKEGVHTVRILKSSEINDGKLILNNFSADMFLTPQAKPELKIEFIGDSITTGYGVLGDRGDRTVKNSDACSSFAYLTAQKLNADYSCVALQGICVKAYMWQPNLNMADMYTYLSPLNRKPHEYEQDIDVIVLNLGTNDATYIGQNAAYAETFPSDYRNFLSQLRAAHSDALIVCTYGMMGVNPSVETGIKEAIRETDDEKIVYYPSPVQNTSGANGHPDAAAHAEMAEHLSEYISSLRDRL